MREQTTHKVRVISRSCRNIVVPGHLILNRGDSVEFKTVNNKDATILIPHGNLFGEDNRVFDLDEKNQWTQTLTVSNIEAGVYPYAVYCKESNDFAEGNSPPTMIIDE